MNTLQAVAIFCLVPVAVTILSMESMDLRLVNNEKENISPLGGSWRSRSPLACAVACLARRPVFNSFVYNLLDSSCTLGNKTAGDTPRDVKMELLYTYSEVPETLCPKRQGFTSYSNVNGSICFWLSPSYLSYSYEEADQHCRDKGLQLLTLKTLEKFYLFLDAVRVLGITFNFWIGLDDIKEEGIFCWRDDGSNLSTTMKPILFNIEEPSDFNNEDCVEYSVSRSPCNDASCSKDRRFSCEALPRDQITFH